MEAMIISFRRARHHTYDNQMILSIEGVDTREKATKLIGKTVVWNSPAEKEISGKVSGAHGNNGCVRTLFESGMPGQSLGSKVKLS